MELENGFMFVFLKGFAARLLLLACFCVVDIKGGIFRIKMFEKCNYNDYDFILNNTLKLVLRYSEVGI